MTAADISAGRHLEVLATGPLTTVQDLGRPGYASVGVSPSGAADRGALALANRLVGNDVAAAGLELTLGGLSVRAGTDLIIAVTGAGFSKVITLETGSADRIANMRAFGIRALELLAEALG